DWRFTHDGLDAAGVRTLRWPTWREQRGSIYGLAISRDNRHVAIAGLGVITSTVSVLDRATGKVEASLTDVHDLTNALRAPAFPPDGNTVAFGPTDGSVWVWNWHGAQANDARRLGGTPNKDSKINNIRLLTWPDAGHVLSAAEGGQVVLWDVNRRGGD